MDLHEMKETKKKKEKKKKENSLSEHEFLMLPSHIAHTALHFCECLIECALSVWLKDKPTVIYQFTENWQLKIRIDFFIVPIKFTI